jgi:V/A-type H+-transporting ATPase subunit I
LPAEKTASLAGFFESEGVPAGMDFFDPQEGENPPTSLKNSSWAQSIQPLYDFMGMVPSYSEPDSSALFLGMLTVFSAFLVADAGYGAVVLLALLAAYKPLVARGADKNALHLGIILFGGTTLLGIALNSWFGENYRLFSAYTFDPGTAEGMVLLQGICFLMGVMHLTIAHIWKVSRRTLDISVLAEAGWVFFLWGMYGIICKLILKQEFVLPQSWIGPLFQIAFALILLFTAPSWNPLKSIPAGIGAILQNGANCFSDIVSYIRLWAVGLAGGKVAMAFNNIAAMLPGFDLLPAFALRLPIWILGHGVNIILGVIAILAHGVRLNLLEFSNHLELEWSGRKYDPFKEIK